MKHVKRVFLYSVFALLIVSCSQKSKQQSSQKKDRMEWFKEAKFGMFIHWGPYSKLAGEWKGQQVPVGENAEWIMQKMQIPVEEYREMASTLNPVQFNAEEWVSLAKQTGMKYIVITSKHHDGFAMYDSQVSDYDIVEHTPYKKDPMKALADACEKEGIKLGFYYSHREDWNHPYAYGNTWDFDSSQTNLDSMDHPGLFRKYIEEKAKPQVKELLDTYHPRIIWFDRGMYTQEQGREFVDLVHNLSPECLVNGRVGHYDKELLGDYQSLSDHGLPVGGVEEYFEALGSVNKTWGYSKFDTNWKSAREIIRRLVMSVSKGGNYLLNVGPTGKGVIPEPVVKRFKRVGEWMQNNNESIYGTTASPFTEAMPWGYVTRKGEKLYLHVFQWPEDQQLEIEGLRNTVNRAYMLGDRETNLKVRRNNNRLMISLSSEPENNINSVAVLEIEGEPTVDPPVVKQEGNQAIVLDYIHAITKGNAIKRYNRKGKYHIGKWQKPEDNIQWHVNVNTTGVYDVFVTYSARPEWEGQPYVVNVGDNRLESTIVPSTGWYEYQTLKVGSVELNKKGRKLVEIHPGKILSKDLMYFKTMELRPAF